MTRFRSHKIILTFCLAALLCMQARMSAYADGSPDASAWDDGAFLFENAERFIEAKGEDGPWYYDSDDITMTVTRACTQDGRRYVMADVRMRHGATFFSGAAFAEEGTRRSELPHVMARRYRAVIGFTGDFLPHTENPKGVMIRNRNIYHDKKDADMLALYPDGGMETFPKGSVTAQELLDKGVRDVYAFGPILLKDGAFYEPAWKHFVAGNNRRCAVGMIEKGHYLVIATLGNFNVEALAGLFAAQGCQLAYNLDGGRSSNLILMGEQLNAHSYDIGLQSFQRPLPDMVLAGESELVPAMDAPIRYTNIRIGSEIPK